MSKNPGATPGVTRGRTRRLAPVPLRHSDGEPIVLGQRAAVDDVATRHDGAGEPHADRLHQLDRALAGASKQRPEYWRQPGHRSPGRGWGRGWGEAVHAGRGRRREPRQRHLAVAVGALGSDVRWWQQVP
jgi:hypothetical protein